MEALASHDDIRGALIATLKERVDVARQYLSLDTPENLRERLAVLAYAAETALCRSLDELKRYHASALRLIEDMSHGTCPGCGDDPSHPGVVPCYDCQTVCVHDPGCQEDASRMGR